MFDEFDVALISKKSQTGYIFEVDLEYPDELHELHNDYPLASEIFSFLWHAVKLLQKHCLQIWDKSWWHKKINSKFRQQN